MKFKRLYQTIRLWMIPGDYKRAQWAKKHDIYMLRLEKTYILWIEKFLSMRN